MTMHYEGLRYTMKFYDDGNGGCEWTSTVPYEYFTVVTHQGNSYTSKGNVPIGIDIANATYWVKTSDYNAQIDIYKNLLDGKAEQKALDTTNTNVATLQGQMGAANGDITQLQIDVAAGAKQSDLNTANGNISTLQSQMATKAAQTDLNSTNANLSALSTSVTNLTADTATRAKQSDLNTTNENISTLQSQMATKAAQTDLNTTNDNVSTLAAKLSTAETNIANNTPVGTLQTFLLPSAPTGWLELNGQWVSKTTYATLFNAISSLCLTDSTNHPNEFQLPDLETENRFLRSLSGTKVLGTAEASNTPQHKHPQTLKFNSAGYQNGNGLSYTSGNTVANDVVYTGFAEQFDGTETRPNSYAVLMCVKY